MHRRITDPVSEESRQVRDRDHVEPSWPIDVGLADPLLRSEDVEGARLLENEARARLESDGFTDAQILRWVEAFFAARRAGDVDGLIAWIHDQEHPELPDAEMGPTGLPVTGS
jgi:hypothetical protein